MTNQGFEVEICAEPEPNQGQNSVGPQGEVFKLEFFEFPPGYDHGSFRPETSHDAKLLVQDSLVKTGLFEKVNHPDHPDQCFVRRVKKQQN